MNASGPALSVMKSYRKTLRHAALRATCSMKANARRRAGATSSDENYTRGTTACAFRHRDRDTEPYFYLLTVRERECQPGEACDLGPSARAIGELE